MLFRWLKGGPDADACADIDAEAEWEAIRVTSDGPL